MFARLSLRIFLPLFSVQSRGIVIKPEKLQSPFYKPFPNFYTIKHKVKHQSRWDDPNYIYPMPTIKPSLKKGKSLIQQLENEERDRLKSIDKVIEPVRSGDVVRFGYYRSISSKKVLNLEGLVIQTAKKNSLQASCNVLINYHFSDIEMKFKIYSPMLKYFRVSKFGSGRLRNRLGFIRGLGLKGAMTREPIINNTQYRKRIPKGYGKILNALPDISMEVL